MPNDFESLLNIDEEPKGAVEKPTKKAPEREPAPKLREGIEKLHKIEVVCISFEAVVGGALMRIDLGPDTDPTQVKPWLMDLDPNAQVRDAFPMKGSFQPKETKLAKALTLLTNVMRDKKFVTIGCETNEDEIQVSIGQKKVDEMLNQLISMDKLSKRNRAKLKKSLEEKTEEFFRLKEGESFGVKYWTTDDGKHFCDSIQAEAPQIKVKDDDDQEGGKDEDE